MANRVPAKYRLLVGPYRLALWLALCRFKRRCVENFVNAFFEGMIRNGKIELTDAHVAAIADAYVDFDKAHATFSSRTRYEQLLSDCMKRLLGEVDVEDRERLRTIDTAKAAAIRVQELDQYLTTTKHLWGELQPLCKSLIDNPTQSDVISFKNKLYRAVAQSLWPYYGVVYERRQDVVLPGEDSPYNFSTWVPNADLLSVSFLPQMERYVVETVLGGAAHHQDSDGSLENLLLYPSITDEGLSDEGLREILNAASGIPFDFDTPKGVAGHVQVLRDAGDTSRAYPPLEVLFKKGVEAIQSPFTDLYYFVNDVVRCVIKPQAAQTPTGVLFLAAPSLDVLRNLLKTSGNDNVEPLLINLVRESWDEIGGAIFSKNFYRDFDDLRTKFFPALEMQDRVFAYESIGHSLKSLVGITGWLSSRDRLREARSKLLSLQNRLEHSSETKIISAAIENAYRSLGMFALPQSMGHFVRYAATARDKNWPKLRDWVDSGDALAWNADTIEVVCTKYAQSIFLLAQGICLGCYPYPWKVLLVECDNAVAEWRSRNLNGDEEWPSNFMQELHFPPFKKGADANYLFIFALTESICNAITALVKCTMQGTAPLAGHDSALRIRVFPNLETSEMVVSVRNVSLNGAPGRISGLDQTKRMLDDFDFVSFDDLASVRMENGLFQISSVVRFRPFSLSEKLIAHAGE